jgi:nicotinamide-nucleotide amidase
MNKDMEIICIGNELLIGKTLNTNAHWIAQQATAMGIRVNRITVVPDEIPEIANVLSETINRKPRFTLITGGLGPTFDDKSLEGIAKALNRKFEVNAKALKMVRKKYKEYAAEKGTEQVELTPSRVKMATLPEKAEPIPNPVGTAPGVRVKLKQTLVVALPGVPSEMKGIFDESVKPLLKQAAGKTGYYAKAVYVAGIMESSLAPLIDVVMRNHPDVYVKSHPKGGEDKPHIEIHVSTKSENAEKAEEKLQKVINQLSNAIIEVGGKVSGKEQLDV